MAEIKLSKKQLAQVVQKAFDAGQEYGENQFYTNDPDEQLVQDGIYSDCFFILDELKQCNFKLVGLDF